MLQARPNPATGFLKAPKTGCHKPRGRSVMTIAGALVILSTLFLVGCKDKKLDKPLIPPLSRTVAPSLPAKSDLSAAQRSSAMPLPGQAKEHAVLAPQPAQKPASR